MHKERMDSLCRMFEPVLALDQIRFKQVISVINRNQHSQVDKDMAFRL